MPNSLYQELTKGSQSSSTPNSALSSNPILNALARKNPTLAQVLREIQENGGDAKGLFYKKAQQMGVDPNYILNQIVK